MVASGMPGACSDRLRRDMTPATPGGSARRAGRPVVRSPLRLWLTTRYALVNVCTKSAGSAAPSGAQRLAQAALVDPPSASPEDLREYGEAVTSRSAQGTPSSPATAAMTDRASS